MAHKHQKTSKLNKIIIQIVKDRHPKTVKELVELIREQNALPQQEIIDQVLHLQNQGKITLKEEITFTTPLFESYLLSSRSYWYWITISLALATVTTVFFITENTTPFIYVRYVLGSLFVLFLPGYSLIRVLFPKKELNNIERYALSIGMSIALVPITGLILNYSPWGIRPIPITLSLLVLTAVLATAAIIREYQNIT